MRRVLGCAGAVNRREPRLPIEPLAELIERDRPDLWLALGRTLHKAYRRALVDGGVTWRCADKLCGALGLHPTEVWGPEFYYGLEDETCAF